MLQILSLRLPHVLFACPTSSYHHHHHRCVSKHTSSSMCTQQARPSLATSSMASLVRPYLCPPYCIVWINLPCEMGKNRGIRGNKQMNNNNKTYQITLYYQLSAAFAPGCTWIWYLTTYFNSFNNIIIILGVFFSEMA